MFRIYTKFILLLIVFIPMSAKSQVIATIPDTTSMPDSTIQIPVNVDLRSYGIISYYFEIAFDPLVVSIDSVSVAGTLSEKWAQPVINTNFYGKIIVGAFTAGDTIRGQGKLLDLVCHVTGNDGDSSLVSFSGGYFNNGSPSVYRKGGVLKIKQTTPVTKYQSVVMPEGSLLIPNYPDPFIFNTTISYRLDKVQNVRIKIVNVLGREIAVLINSRQDPREYTLSWNGSDASGNPLPTGIYFCVFQTGSLHQVEKMTIVR